MTTDAVTVPEPEVKKPVRKLKVLPSQDGEFYWVALNSKGEPVYNSETYKRKSGAIKSARREHEGRSNFQYILEYEDNNGNLVKEILL